LIFDSEAWRSHNIRRVGIAHQNHDTVGIAHPTNT